MVFFYMFAFLESKADTAHCSFFYFFLCGTVLKQSIGIYHLPYKVAELKIEIQEEVDAIFSGRYRKELSTIPAFDS